MKNIRFSMVLLIVLVLVAPVGAQTFPDQHDHKSCQYCGMDRLKFGHSRMLVSYKDGSEVGTCSLHCMALEYASSISRIPLKLMVADFNSGKLVDAQTASWVLGGDRPGVMTARAKWAFASPQSAEKFVAEHGGQIIDFEQALKASYEDMYADVQRIRNMRAMKMKKMKGK